MKRLIIPILVLFLVTISCSMTPAQPTATPVPTKKVVLPTKPAPTEKVVVPTETKAPPPTVEPVQIMPTDTVEPTQELLPTEPLPTVTNYFTDEFDGDLSGWRQWVVAGNSDLNYARGIVGRLHFELPSTETYAYEHNINYTYDNVLVQTQFNPVDAAGKNGIALICRVSDQGWYELRVSTIGDRAGWIQIFRYDPKLKANHENPYVDLLMPTYKQDSLPVAEIKPGFNKNTIGLACNGNSLSVYANGKPMMHPRLKEPIVITDTTLTNGTVGVGVMSFSSGKVFIDFDWVSTKAP
jgi:hypothetical protein